jgi:diketogulonate reductase-like aldo/keto reductase
LGHLQGALPIPGAKTAEQAQENAGALGWRLTEEEVAKLDAASDSILEGPGIKIKKVPGERREFLFTICIMNI